MFERVQAHKQTCTDSYAICGARKDYHKMTLACGVRFALSCPTTLFGVHWNLYAPIWRTHRFYYKICNVSLRNYQFWYGREHQATTAILSSYGLFIGRRSKLKKKGGGGQAGTGHIYCTIGCWASLAEVVNVPLGSTSNLTDPWVWHCAKWRVAGINPLQSSRAGAVSLY